MLGVLLCLLVIVQLSIGEDFIKVSIITKFGDYEEKSLPRSVISQIVKDFVDYHLYFNTAKKVDSLQCLPGDQWNITEAALSQSINICGRSEYRPRQLQRSQISWKQTNTANNNGKNNNTNSTTSNNSTSSNSNTKENSGSRVHDFLVFGLLLPEHPFSQQTRYTLQSIATLFPQVTIVTGDAYEFSDLANKYFVRSFPAVLLFKSGLFVGDYEGEVSVSALSSHLVLWTQQLPHAIPFALPSPKNMPSHYYMNLTSYYEYYHNYYSSHYNISLQLLTSQLPELLLPLPFPNLEPFLGSVKQYRIWDSVTFLLCGLYTIFRMLFYIKSSFAAN
jgi:hypothetical protein